MKAPATYAEWVAVLDAFASRANDAEVVAAMQQGTIEWQAGVAPRFVEAVGSALQKRLDAMHERFDRDIRSGAEADVHRALRFARGEFKTILAALEIGAVPEETRNDYVAQIRQLADDMQSQLETQAQGALRMLVKQSPVNRF